MAKDKKKKQDKKRNKGGSALTAVAPAKRAKPGKSAKLTRRLQAISENPLLADIVAAALVATASALKDSKKARQLAASAGRTHRFEQGRVRTRECAVAACAGDRPPKPRFAGR